MTALVFTVPVGAAVSVTCMPDWRPNERIALARGWDGILKATVATCARV
jgi:hypothetical protein